jgi:hypothetical protein
LCHPIDTIWRMAGWPQGRPSDDSGHPDQDCARDVRRARVLVTPAVARRT